MGQKWSSFLKRRICNGVPAKSQPTEKTIRLETIEKFFRKHLLEGDFLEFTDIEPTDEKSRIINKECHEKEYISHLEHIRVTRNPRM